MAIQRLTAAYRSRSRPSSTLGAKASTVCPYYLDGDLVEGEPKFSLGDTRYIGYCAVFKVRKEVSRHERRPGTKSSSDRRMTRRSLKTQQHAESQAIRSGEIEDFSAASPSGDAAGSVDMSSDRMHSEGLTS